MDYEIVGDWTEDKLKILKEYCSAYSIILTKQKENIDRFRHIYIDAFAGKGRYISKMSGKEIAGSPLNALSIEHPFDEYIFIELEADKASDLRALSKGNDNVTIYQGNCNELLINEIFPKVKYEEYKRALCFLDPYGAHIDWNVIMKAGQMGTIELFINFSIMDINRNILRKNTKGVPDKEINRMNSFWGSESWRNHLFSSTPGLFEDITEKAKNHEIAEAYRVRLEQVAGFKYVPKPIPMKNTQGGIVYYLFFATHNEKGNRIMKAIFKKFDKG